jgi:hypothetical protein
MPLHRLARQVAASVGADVEAATDPGGSSSGKPAVPAAAAPAAPFTRKRKGAAPADRTKSASRVASSRTDPEAAVAPDRGARIWANSIVRPPHFRARSGRETSP